MITKILVLGSEGQIGNHLIKFLREKKYDVVEFDILNSPKQDLRLENNKLLKKYILETDFVFFLAFDVGGSKYLSQYQKSYEFIHNNISIMKNTFQYLQELDKPFIFASTQMSNMIHSSYGVLKAIGEFYTKSIGGIVAKFWNVYGIEKDLEKSHVITDFILKGLKYGEIKMLTDGEEEREFLYADDCCEALYSIMKNFSECSLLNKIDITSFKSVKIKDVAEIVSQKLGNIRVVPSNNKDIIQQNFKNIADSSILKWWSPTTSLEEGIEKMINYYIQK